MCKIIGASISTVGKTKIINNCQLTINKRIPNECIELFKINGASIVLLGKQKIINNCKLIIAN